MAVWSVVLITACALLMAGMLRVSPHERVAVFRLGRFLRVAGPGRLYTIPFIDKVARVDLNARVPHWRGLAETEVVEEVKRMIRASGHEA